MHRLSYGNVMSTIALFVALGGTSYAALKVTGKQVRNGTLSTKDVRDRSLRGVDFRRGTLEGREIADGSLDTRDFRAGAIPELPGPQGAPGPQGDTGPPGPAGPAGPLRDVAHVSSSATTDQAVGVHQAMCEPGLRALGGGFVVPHADARVLESAPVAAGGRHGWRVKVERAAPAGEWSFGVRVICATG